MLTGFPGNLQQKFDKETTLPLDPTQEQTDGNNMKVGHSRDMSRMSA